MHSFSPADMGYRRRLALHGWQPRVYVERANQRDYSDWRTVYIISNAFHATIPTMADLQVLALPDGGFALVAFALSIFNFFVSLWSIMKVRAMKGKASQPTIAS